MTDIVEIIINHLSSNLDVPVAVSVPQDKPPEIITVQRLGGGESDVVLDHPTIAIQAWSTSNYKANQLMNKIAKLMKEINNPAIKYMRRQTHYYFPDSKRNPRYQAIYEFTTIYK